MTQVARRYSLRRFANSRDPDYPTALSIYSNNVPAAARSSSNEITYWLDRTYAEFGDEFVVCGFFVDRRVAGYAQFSLMRSSRVLFFDYFVIHPEYRTMGSYLEFARLLREMAELERLEFDYLVGEVSFESADSTPARNSIRLVRLFKQMGFGVADCEYRYPPLGHHQADTGLRAFIMMLSQTRVRQVSRETMCHVMKTIYLEYYARWFAPFTEDLDHYNRVLKGLYTAFVQSLQGKATVSVNGIALPAPITRSRRPDRSKDPMPLGKPLVILSTCVAVAVVLCCTIAYSRLDVWTTTVVCAMALLSVALAFAIVYRAPRQLFLALLKTLRVFGKSK